MVSIKQRHRGFTLLEVVVVLALVTSIVALTLFFSLDSYRQSARLAEVSTILTLLTTARAAAMNTVDGQAHGLRFTPSGYVVFTGASFTTSNPVSRIVTPAAYPLVLASSSPSEVVFTLLSGTTTAAVITFVDPQTSGSSSIRINSEGLIE